MWGTYCIRIYDLQLYTFEYDREGAGIALNEGLGGQTWKEVG